MKLSPPVKFLDRHWTWVLFICRVASVTQGTGLTVVLPVLGHATWHLYRRTVEPDRNPHPDYQPREHPRRSAADFPAALLPAHWWGKSDIGENG